jgi:hypothetical protein
MVEGILSTPAKEFDMAAYESSNHGDSAMNRLVVIAKEPPRSHRRTRPEQYRCCDSFAVVKQGLWAHVEHGFFDLRRQSVST